MRIYYQLVRSGFSANSARLERKQVEGFSLVELLIALALTSIAIVVAGQIIVSQLKENISQELQKQLADDWGRASEFINDELFAAERAYTVDGTTTGQSIINKASQTGMSGACGLSANDVELALALKDGSTFILYAVTPIKSSESTLWRGPYVLRRCGPMQTSLSTSGDLNGESINSIIIGGLPNRQAFDAVRGMNSLGGALAARDVELSLTVNSQNLSHSGMLGGQSRVSPSYNLLNDEATTGSSCNTSTSQTALLCGPGTLEFTETNCPPYTGTAINRSEVSVSSSNCGLSRVHQFKPSGIATIIGSQKSGIEDVIYFDGIRENYNISPCSRVSCVVKSKSGGDATTIKNGNVLVFRDREIRI